MRRSTRMRLDSVVILVLMIELTYLPTASSKAQQGLPDYKLIRICQTDSLLCSTILQTQSHVPLTRRETDANLIERSNNDGEASAHYPGKNGDRSIIGAYNRRIPRIGKYMRFGRGGASPPLPGHHHATQNKQLDNNFPSLTRNFVRLGQGQVY